MRTVEAAGTGMAFPSTTAYLTRDDGIEGPSALERAQAEPAEEVATEGAASEPDPTWEEDDDDGAEEGDDD